MRNIKTLAIQMSKVTNDISTEIMKEAFSFRGEIGYELRQQNILRRSLVNSVYNGIKRVSFLGPRIWEMIPENKKKLESLNSFKKEIKNWKPNLPFADYVKHI